MKATKSTLDPLESRESVVQCDQCDQKTPSDVGRHCRKRGSGSNFSHVFIKDLHVQRPAPALGQSGHTSLAHQGMKRSQPLPDTHPEFSVLEYPNFREYRVENWHLARDGSGRVIRHTSAWGWRDIFAAAILSFIWPKVCRDSRGCH